MYLAQSDDALLGPHTAATQHHVVAVHLSVVWEAAHRRYRLLRRVVLG